MFEISSSSFIPTLPTATPKQSTFFNWNLIVDLTSVIFPPSSSLWEMGVGNLPAVDVSVRLPLNHSVMKHTLGETWTQETRDLLDQGIGGDEGVIFAGELLDQLFVFIELLQVVCGHGVHTAVLGSIDIMLVSQDTVPSKPISISLIGDAVFGMRGFSGRAYQTLMPGRGTRGSLTVPEKRLSR